MKDYWELTYKVDGWEFTYAVVECIKPTRTKKWKELLKILDNEDIDSIKCSVCEFSL